MRRAISIFSFSLSLLLHGCGASTYFSTPAPDPMELTCSTSVLDYGTKTSLVSRGAVSDIKMPPGSSYPATAYVDGSLVIKLTYWDGGGYVTEVVGGDANASSIRLIFLSNGIPWVFWGSGGLYLKAAVRSAAIGSSGTWSTGIIDSGTTTTAFEAAVSPLDQIGILYLTDIAVTGRPRFLYCSSCSSLAGFRTMTSTSYIEDTNVVANEMAVGMAWCKANSTTYYPAVTYAVTGITRYAVCRQGSISDCLTTSNWETQTVTASGNVSNKVFLDPTVTGDVPKVASLGAGGIDLYEMGSTACTSAPAAFTAGTALGGATSGNRAMTFLKDSSGKFHLFANESTTSFRYYNSQTTTFSGAWNSAGTIQTATIASPAWTGATIDPSTNALFASYGVSNFNNDLRVARVLDHTIASNTANFRLSQLDGTGNIQLTATPRRNISMASTSGGVPAVAYVDYSATASQLKYAIRTGTSASSSWRTCTIPDALFPQSPSLAFDGNDHPWISYFDVTLVRFNVATTSSSDCNGTWVTYEFPHVPSGAQASAPANNDTSVTRYGSTESILMTIVDTNTTSRGLYASLLTPSTGNWSQRQFVATLGSSAAGVIDLAADEIGNAALVYQDLSRARVHYTASVDGTSWANPVGISAVNQGMGAHIEINPSTGFPVATYFDRSNNSVYYNRCDDTPMGCMTSAWNSVQLDSLAGVSGLASANDLLLSASLVFTDLEIPYVIYPRGKSADGNLIATGIGATTNVSTIISMGSNANFADTPALNYAVAGWGVASSRNAAGFFTSAYIGPGNWLYTTSCGD